MLATDEVSPFYDPMVAKVIAYGKTREDAIRLLARAVDDSVLLGVNSNKQFWSIYCAIQLLLQGIPILHSSNSISKMIPAYTIKFYL